MRRSLFVATLAALGALAACGGGGDASATAPPTNLSGTYVLQSIDGEPLPVTLDDGTGTIEVIENRITFSGRSFVDALTASYDGGEPFAQDFPGNYSRDGADVEMVYQGGEAVTGTVNDDVLVLHFESGIWRYQK